MTFHDVVFLFPFRRRLGPKTKQTTQTDDERIESPPQIKHRKLTTLTKNLDKEIAAEVENCWINPEKITAGNVLGNGASTITFKILRHFHFLLLSLS